MVGSNRDLGEWGQGFGCNQESLPSARQPGLVATISSARRCPREEQMKYRDPDFSWGWVRTLSAAGGSWRAGTPRRVSDSQTRTPSAGPTYRGP